MGQALITATPEAPKPQSDRNSDIEAIFPLTPVQQGMLFHSLSEEGGSAYVNQLIVDLAGPLDPQAFEQAWHWTARRHGALRTTFAWKHGKAPVQIVHRRAPLDWRVEPATDLDAFLERDRAQGFQLEKAPPLRMTLIRQGEDRHTLVLTHHHLIVEGWSWSILSREAFDAYRALQRGEQPEQAAVSPTFRDFVAWLGRQDHSEAESWWRAELADLAAPTPLPMARPAPPQTSRHWEEETRPLPAALAEALATAARRERVTQAAVFQVAWGILLARHAGEDQAVFGTPVSGRTVPFPGADGIVGLFINTVPVRLHLPPEQTVGAVLRGFVAQQGERERHCHAAPSDVQAWSGLGHGTPVFESLLVIEAFPVGDTGPGAHDGLRVTDVRSVERTHYPLSLTIQTGRRAQVHLVWDAGRLDSASARLLLDRYLHVLAEMAEDCARPAAAFDIAAPDEYARIAAWNATRAPIDPAATLHGLIATQAKRTPDAVAVVCGEESLSYAALEHQSAHIAAVLRRHDIGPGSRVGVCLHRSIGMVAAVLGVMKAGAAYVPLDPDFPPDRLTMILEDCAAPVVLTEPGLEDLVSGPARLVMIDAPELGAAEPAAEVPTTTGADLAYVLYTSGSTGRPKGVEVTHRNVVNFLTAMANRPGLSASDRLVAVTTLSFDIAALEVWLPLTVGARTIIASREEAVDGARLAAILEQSGATVMQATPATWRLLLAAGWSGKADLTALCGGEALPRPLARTIAGRCKALWNMYGPTETTIWSSVRPVAATDDDDGGGSEPIGPPIANTRFDVLDAQGRALPVGIVGELAIGGEGVARGYLGRPDLTAARFVEREGERVYLTGDLVRWRADGTLDFLSRRDSQVKLRGYRIELGEIEAALTAHPSVRAAAVSLFGDRLIAYVVAEGALNTVSLRQVLAARLPYYMCPSAFVALDALPLTPNGKIDRKALPAPPEDKAAAPSARDGAQDLACSLFADVLGRSHYEPEDNFFEQGGHSLLATQLAARLREAFASAVTLRDLLDAPTPAGLCARIAALDGRPCPPPLEHTEQSTAPLSFTQERLWFLDRLEGGSPVYVIPLSVRITGPLEPDTLRRALQAVIDRHAALRTRFVATPDDIEQKGGEQKGVEQSVMETVTVSLPLIDLPGEGDQAERLASEEMARPIDLANPPFFRFRLVRFGAEDHLLLGAVHHVVFDGWSSGVLLREVAALYTDPATSLPPLPVQFGDYARWQRAQAQNEDKKGDLAWWTHHLAGAPPLLDLPTDFPRPPVQTYSGDVLRFTLDPTTAQALESLGRQAGATPFMVMLAAFQTLLWRYTGQTDIPVGSPVANRPRPELDGLIGCFVNTVVLRADLSADPTFRQLITQVRRTCLEAYSRQEVPFERLVEAMAPRRDLSHSPLFQVMMAMEAAPFDTAHAGPLTLRPQLGQPKTAKVDLSLFVARTERGVDATLEYNTDLFLPATIAAMAGHFRRLLAAIVAEPRRRLSELALLDEAERTLVVEQFNRTARSYPREGGLDRLLSAQQARTPDAVAVIDGNTRLTYAQLHHRADQIARHLIDLGAGPEVRVGVALRRSAELVATILGVIKSGAAYVPIDPAYPPDRIALIIADARMPIVVTQAALEGSLPPHAARTVWLESITADAPADPPPSRTDARDLFYVLYTSGSTGVPKGVALPHRGAVALMSWAQQAFTPRQLSRVLFSTSVCFDLSVFEMFVPLCVGGAVVVAENALALPDLPARNEVTLINTVPSAIAALVRAGRIPSPVQTINLAGEACPLALVKALYATGTVTEVFNLYGPTEDTVYSTFALIGPNAPRVTVGKPIANGRAYILDRHFQPVPVGVAGEIWLTGDGLARGYHNRPAQTADRFMPDPLSPTPGGRMYRTGDRGRWLADGTIEYLGRLDFMVKFNGFRIELGEIEAALQAQPGVADSVAMVREDAGHPARLVAYVTGHGVEPASLRAALKTRLPDYMVPSVVVVLERLPLTPNGKTDRKALPPPVLSVEDAPPPLPEDGTEGAIAQVWRQVLPPEARFGLHDTFFDVGGHSLLVLKMHAALVEAFPSVTVVDLFRFPSIAALARHIDAAATAATTTAPAPQDRGQKQRQAAQRLMRRAAPRKDG